MKKIVAAGVGTLVLSGCGGAGGAINSTPTPPVSTPTPAATNSTITNLTASQSFANDASRTDVAFNLTSNTTIQAKAAATPVTVSYEAGSNSYVVTSGGVTDTFSVADRQTGTVAGETRYVRRSGDSSTYLTLVTTPYSGRISNSYVALGYLQRNAISASRQDTGFITFAYGLDTPASGVPRTGSGTFATDVFGLESVPGAEPEVFQGRGRFDVDLANGLFSTTTNVTRTGLITGQGVVGGGIDLTGGGRLSATSGTFAGEVVYSAGGRRISGQLAGRFYGPNAQEIGASFAGALTDGSAFNGSLTGQRDTTLTPVNISFAQLVTPQLFYADATTLTVRTPRNGGAPVVSDYPGSIGTAQSRSQFTDRTSGNVTFAPPTSNLAGGNYTVTSIVAGPANFTSYALSTGGQATRLELYKTGPDNRELALTYASFGRYATALNDDPLQTESDRVFFVYGFNTPTGLFSGRTGSASYTGVAYGAGATPTGTILDVSGTARMTVDFGAQTMAGSLALTAGTVDYGQFGFAGRVFSSANGTADISRAGGAATGAMLVNFYGPSADEAAGIFRLRVPDGAGANTLINGAMVAKKQ